jgi:hypothetical protein
MSKLTQELFREAHGQLIFMLAALEKLREIRGMIFSELELNPELKDSVEFNMKAFNIEMQILMAECLFNDIFPKAFRATIKRRLTLCNRTAAEAGIPQLLYESIEKDARKMVESFRQKLDECTPPMEGTD